MAENLSGGVLPKRSATCTSPLRHSAGHIDFPSQPPPHLTSFASVENLMLNLTMNATTNSNGSQQPKEIMIVHDGKTPSQPPMHRSLSSASLSHIGREEQIETRTNGFSDNSSASGYNMAYTKPTLSFDEMQQQTSNKNADLCTMTLGRKPHRRKHNADPQSNGSLTTNSRLSSASSVTLNSQSSDTGNLKYGYTVVLSTTPKSTHSSSSGKSSRRVVENDPPPYVPPPSYDAFRSSNRSLNGSGHHNSDSDSSYSSARSHRSSSSYSPHVFGPGYVPRGGRENVAEQPVPSQSRVARRSAVVNLAESYRLAVGGTPPAQTGRANNRHVLQKAGSSPGKKCHN